MNEATGKNINKSLHWGTVTEDMKFILPSSRLLTPTDITRLTQSIKESHRMKLLKLRAARVGRDELCAVDSTSRSAYGSSLADIRWGHNN